MMAQPAGLLDGRGPDGPERLATLGDVRSLQVADDVVVRRK